MGDLLQSMGELPCALSENLQYCAENTGPKKASHNGEAFKKTAWAQARFSSFQAIGSSSATSASFTASPIRKGTMPTSIALTALMS